MKRTPLKRKSELKADPEKAQAFVQRGRGSLARRVAPEPGQPVVFKPRQPIKSKPKPVSASERELRAAWAAAFEGKPCAMGCGRRAVHGHHVIREQLIRREVPKERRLEARFDLRNQLRLCMCCHEEHHAHRPLPISAVPMSVYDFARDHPGLERLLSRELERYGRPTTGGAEWRPQ